MTTRWAECYAQRMERMGSSIIRELLKFAQQPGVISFAGGLPAPELFPVKELEEACCKILQEKGPQALQYGTT
ncbi:MAG: aminotransferase, partial [Anaerolineae bacterium]